MFLSVFTYKLVGVLEANKREFSFSLEELGEYKGEPMEIEVNIGKFIFTPAHRLSAESGILRGNIVRSWRHWG